MAGIETAGVIVQGLLFVAAAWYTWETRKVRQSSAAQLALLERKFELSRIPFVVPTMQRCRYDDDSKELVFYDNGKPLRFLERAAVPLAQAHDMELLVGVRNLTDTICQHVRAIVYDSDQKRYFWTTRSAAYLPDKSTFLLVVSPVQRTRREVREHLEERYPDRHEAFDAAIRGQHPSSFVALVYVDADGEPHWTKRTFDVLPDGEITHLLTQRGNSAGHVGMPLVT